MSSDGYVSGESLSEHLGISRTAVWKRISSLRNQGCRIEASTRKGYRMISRDLRYGVAGIQSLLKTRVLGRELRFFDSIDSTNSFLKAMAHEGAPEGLVAVADEQTGGRGRLGRNWSSSRGMGVWMSVLLRPRLHPAKVQAITPAAAVAVCRALEPFLDERPGIKWPNDVLVDGKKVCGILTELSAESEMVSWVVVGMGLNVNQAASDFQEDIRSRASSVSMCMKPGLTADRCILAAELLNRFEQVYRSFLESGPDPIIKEWKEWSVTLGKKVALIGNGTETMADALDIGEDGRLIVRLPDGSVKGVYSGEISLRSPDGGS